MFRPRFAWLLASYLIPFLFLCFFTQDARAERIEAVPSLKKHFDERGVSGTFVVFEPGTDVMQVYDGSRAARRYTPASTFKIANALIGLNAGVVKDVDEVLPYGGKPQHFKQWEHDMSLREAMKLSAVPIFQELARRIGRERMADSVNAFDYGNRRIGSAVDRFWLEGPLAISAIEQTRFLARLVRGDLPVSKAALDAVKAITLQERTEGREVHYKTGWVFESKPQLGWIVGWVEKQGAVHVFALNIDMDGPADTSKRWPIAKACLAELGKL